MVAGGRVTVTDAGRCRAVRLRAGTREPRQYFEPFQYSEGINYVLVNGALVVDGGKPTIAKPGRVLSPQRPRPVSR